MTATPRRGRKAPAPPVRPILALAVLASLAVLADLAWAPRPARAANLSRLFLSEVMLDPAGPDAGNQYVEITNLGPAEVNLSTWSICTQIQYRQFPQTARIAPYGTFLIYLNRSGTPADTVSTWHTGPYVTLTANGSFGLYHSVGGYTTPFYMEDFVQWGSAGQHLENVAIAAGIWSAGNSLTVPPEGSVLSYKGTKSLPHPVADYAVEAPSPQELNPFLISPPLTINEVYADPEPAGPGQTFFEIANTGATPVSLGHTRWRYGTAGGAALSGTFAADRVLKPGRFLVLHFNAAAPDDSANVYLGAGPELDPAGGSLALYKNPLNDDDPLNLIDFMEWGAGGQPLEAVAVAGAQWVAGEFVPRPAAGQSIDYRGTGSGPASWCVQFPPTPGGASTCSAVGVPDDGTGPGAARLKSAPNPFSGSTRITATPGAPGDHATLVIYDVRGRLVRRLFAGPLPAEGLNVTWDGRDDDGRLLPAGAYWSAMTGDGPRLVRRLVFVR